MNSNASHTVVQPVPKELRLEMVIGMQTRAWNDRFWSLFQGPRLIWKET